MLDTSYKHLFRRSLEAAPERLHFAAHSHHHRLDATREAQLEAWDDAALHADLKWGKVFGEVVPEAQAHIARTLGTPDPSDIVFAPNVHDLLVRLVSSIESKPVRILTTGGEFHSFSRQAARWIEAGQAVIESIATEPFDSLAARFEQALQSGTFDLVYASHVFFDSGYVFEEVFDLLSRVPDPTLCFVDGYHGFMAVPTNLKDVAARVFYSSGGYKYAMCGEDACFMHAPRGYAERPVDTGWFAGFEALGDEQPGRVPYPESAARFWGATLDPSGLYRLNAAMRTLQSEGLDVAALHARAVALQEQFIAALSADKHAGLCAEQLVPRRGSDRRGNFLTFRRDDAGELQKRLEIANVITDSRGDRLRFGFGLYLDPSDVDGLLARLERL